jgi:CobQ-like glutamine amidotransferase family enzyme
MTLTLVRILPRLLSLNGSLGNAEVLAARLRWWGFSVDVSDLREGEAPGAAPDIAVIGHGTSSMVTPAGDALEGWRDTFHQWMQAGTQWWGLGLGGDLLGQAVRISADEAWRDGVGFTTVRTTLRSERASQEVAGLDRSGREVAGYLNDAAHREAEGVTPLLSFLPVRNERWAGATAQGGEGVYQEGLSVSAVSGPLLALNPNLADDLLRAVLARRGKELPEPTDQHRRVDEAAATARAWIRSRLG